MTPPLLTVLVASWVIPAAADASPASAPTRPAASGLDKVIAALRADARLWYEDKPVGTEADSRLKQIWFTPASVPGLVAAIRTIDPNAVGLYVINKLLRRLSYTSPETIRAALPAVKDLNARVRKTYRDFPPLTDRQVEALRKPTGSSRLAREALEKRRQEKLARERPIAKHNQMVYVLEKYTAALMLLAKDPAEDQAVADYIVQAEKQRSALWITLLDLIAAEARFMILEEGRERAEVIYNTLRPPAIKLKMEKRRSYVNRGKAILRDDDRSRFDVVTVYPGIRLLRTVNRLASASKLPAVKVPKDKDIEKYHREQEKKRRAEAARQKRR